MSGGLKSKGHPIGATGQSQLVELFKQLNGLAEKRQIKDANIGMSQNLEGLDLLLFVIYWRG